MGETTTTTTITLKQRANTYSYYNNSFLLSRVLLSRESAKTRKAKKGEHSLCLFLFLTSLLATRRPRTDASFLSRVSFFFSSLLHLSQIHALTNQPHVKVRVSYHHS